MYLVKERDGQLLSDQVAVYLLREISSGEWVDATYLPPEVDIAARLGVSRTVVRDALSFLERAGLVERARGKGTTINRTVFALHCRLDLKLEYSELLDGMNCEASVDSVQLREEPAGEDVAQQLDIPVGTPMIVREKRVLASGVPVIYSTDYLPRQMVELEDLSGIDWGEPIFNTIYQQAGVMVVSAITHLKAVTGSPYVREKLCQKPEQALLELREIGCTKTGEKILYTVAHYTDFFDFCISRRRIK